MHRLYKVVFMVTVITFFMNLTRAVGVAVSVVTLALYVVLAFFNPYTSGNVATQPPWVFFIMIFLALLAGWASLDVRPFILCLAFLLSFFPVGLYLTFTPGVARWAGVCNMSYLIIAGLLLVSRSLLGTAVSHDN